MGLRELRDWLDEGNEEVDEGRDDEWMEWGCYGTTDPKFPETRATGVKKTGLRPAWDCCYWSLGRKLGEPLWNGRPRIVPSLWGDHSTAARTVAPSPSNSYGPG